MNFFDMLEPEERERMERESAERWDRLLESLPSKNVTMTLHFPCDDPNCAICERSRLQLLYGGWTPEVGN